MILSDKVALVTGASQGLGEAIAIRLAVEGCDILMIDVDERNLLQVKEKISALGRNCLAKKVDVTNMSEIKSFVDEATSIYKKIDYLVNNAGGSFSLPVGLEETTEEDWDKVLDTNLKGTFLCCKAVAPYMKNNHYGSIVNMSSRVARTGGFISAYSYVSAKAGILGLTKKLALDLGPFNIRVNAVAPGLIISGERMKLLVATRFTKKEREEYINSLPLRRFGEPSDIAGAVFFLCCDDSRYITGATIDVNGGGSDYYHK